MIVMTRHANYLPDYLLAGWNFRDFGWTERKDVSITNVVPSSHVNVVPKHKQLIRDALFTNMHKHFRWLIYSPCWNDASSHWSTYNMDDVNMIWYMFNHLQKEWHITFIDVTSLKVRQTFHLHLTFPLMGTTCVSSQRSWSKYQTTPLAFPPQSPKNFAMTSRQTFEL